MYIYRERDDESDDDVAVAVAAAAVLGDEMFGVSVLDVRSDDAIIFSTLEATYSPLSSDMKHLHIIELMKTIPLYLQARVDWLFGGCFPSIYRCGVNM